jgi:hypothetical protein
MFDRIFHSGQLFPLNSGASSLYPTVSSDSIGDVVELNFGADLTAKPFCFNLSNLKLVDGC